LRVVKGALVVPIRDAAGGLHSLQFVGDVFHAGVRTRGPGQKISIFDIS
jgi:hypothetical protein